MGKFSLRMFLGFLSAAVFFCSTATGQEPRNTPQLSMEQAIRTALEKNPAIEAARHRLSASETRITQARSGLLPQVSFSERFSRTTNPMFAFGTRLNQETIAVFDFDPARLNDPDPISDFISNFSAAWSVYDGGRTRSGIRQAELGARTSEKMLHRTRQQVAARTATAFSGVLLAAENIRVVKQALETARAHFRIVASRHRSGFVVKSDLLQAQVRMADLERQLLQAEGELRIAWATLNAAMGVPVDSDFIPADTFPSEAETGLDPKAWSDRALAGRPDLQAIRIQADIAREEIEKARGERLPSVSLLGNYEVHTEDFGDLADSYNMGALVNIPLFSGYRIPARVKEARALMAEAAAMEDELIRQIQVEVRQAFFQAQTAEKQVQVSRGAIGQAEEALRIVRNRYETGLFTIMDLLNAETALQKARGDLTRALYAFAVATAALQLAAGSLDEDFGTSERGK